MNNLKKRIDGEEDDDFQKQSAAPAQGYSQYGGRRSSEFGRRSVDRERYDADPQVIGDDFSGLQLHDSECRIRASIFAERVTNKLQPNRSADQPAPLPIQTYSSLHLLAHS